MQSSGDSKQKSGASAVHKSGVKCKSIVCHSCGEPGHIRPNCPNCMKRVSSPTLDHPLSRKDSFVKDASSQPESYPIAKVRLRIFSYDEVMEAAVIEDITENVLLGSD